MLSRSEPLQLKRVSIGFSGSSNQNDKRDKDENKSVSIELESVEGYEFDREKVISLGHVVTYDYLNVGLGIPLLLLRCKSCNKRYFIDNLSEQMNSNMKNLPLRY